MSLLANVEPSTFWAHLTWTEFDQMRDKERVVVILPIHGFTELGNTAPLDGEEVVTSVALQSAVRAVKSQFPVLTMPPLRFTLGTKAKSFLRIDPPLAHRLLREIATSVRAAGFRKLVFLNSNASSVDLVDAASRDIRADLELQTFVINTGGLGLPFDESSDSRGLVDAATSSNATTGATAGSATLQNAANKLAALLAEISARPPLGTRSHSPIAVPADSTASNIETAAAFPRVYRSRYLMSLSPAELAAYPKANTIVILPTGAIEQHGHHLPVGVDAILGQAALQAALPRLPSHARVLVAPPLTYTKSNEHVGFPGTVFISAESLRQLLLSVLGDLKRVGFERILIYNTHGGNTAVLNYTLREAEETLGLQARLLRPGYVPPLSAQELNYGFHAGEWETALMLAATPELVKMEHATCEFPARLDDPGDLRPENAPAVFSWISRDISKSGVMGDATVATVEKGKAWLEGMAASLADAILKHLTSAKSDNDQSGS